MTETEKKDKDEVWIPLDHVSKDSRQLPVVLKEWMSRPSDETPTADTPTVSSSSSVAVSAGNQSSTPSPLVLFTRTAYAALLDAALQDARFPSSGYLGGSVSQIWVPVLGAWKIGVLVDRVHGVMRDSTTLISGTSTEHPDGIKIAVRQFEETGRECVGWFRTQSAKNPLQPTVEDIAKQAWLQNLVPNGIGALVAMGSTNNAGDKTWGVVGRPLEALTMGTCVYRAEGPTHPPSEVNTLGAVHYCKRLWASKCLNGVLREENIEAWSIKEKHDALKRAVDEAEKMYQAETLECTSSSGDLSARRMFLDSDFDTFLMDFWRRSVVGFSHAVTQEIKNAEYRRLCLKEKIKRRIDELRDIYRDVVSEVTDESNKRLRLGQPLPKVNIREFEEILQELQDVAGRRVELPVKAKQDFTKDFVLLVSSPPGPPAFQPLKDASGDRRYRELLLFEEELEGLKERQKKTKPGRKAITRKTRVGKEKATTPANGKDRSRYVVPASSVQVTSINSVAVPTQMPMAYPYPSYSRHDIERQDAAVGLLSLGRSDDPYHLQPPQQQQGSVPQPPPQQAATVPHVPTLISRSVELLQQSTPFVPGRPKQPQPAQQMPQHPHYAQPPQLPANIPSYIARRPSVGFLPTTFFPLRSIHHPYTTAAQQSVYAPHVGVYRPLAEHTGQQPVQVSQMEVRPPHQHQRTDKGPKEEERVSLPSFQSLIGGLGPPQQGPQPGQSDS
ncbi:hypothetical protein BC832DRAFT_16771 [Gaertneriomyces semiglobifer]|nr:hypothetical protein BC832DRAFT_16771 [Gaertneriomyces semiglobifer]